MRKYARVGETWDLAHPLILQCHHYNALLHQAMVEAPYVDGRGLLFQIASQEFYDFLSFLCEQEKVNTPEGALGMATAVYRNLGFGVLDTNGLSNIGGEVISHSSHLALAYLKKWGVQSEPVDDFGRAFCRAAWAVAYGRSLESCEVVQKACLACGDTLCLFEVTEAVSHVH